jgi:mannose-6-phosphate isomerase-like protein (cupin superfamily)
MSLLARLEDVPERLAGDNHLSTKCVYGHGGGIMRATRPPGYHSRPHVHACEQYNYVVSGELWSFSIDELGRKTAFHSQPGDFKRVPTMAVHWSNNRLTEPVTMIEFHLPGLQDDPKHKGMDVPLFDDGEAHSVAGSPRNLYVDPADVPVAELEALADHEQSSALGYLRKAASIPFVEAGGEGSARIQIAYGMTASLTSTLSSQGYRSTPHFHQSEELNVLVSGSLTAFIISRKGEGHSFELRAGDFLRVPPTAIHWFAHTSAEDAQLVSLNTPGLQYDPVYGGQAVPLLAYDEVPPLVSGSARSFAADPSRYPIAETEAAAQAGLPV